MCHTHIRKSPSRLNYFIDSYVVIVNRDQLDHFTQMIKLSKITSSGFPCT